MTETEAKNPAPATVAENPKGPTPPHSTGTATDRVAVGRATVPGERVVSPTKFMRPAGMTPPPGPGELPPEDRSSTPQTGTKPAASGNNTKAQVAEAVRAARATVSAAASRGPRRARLHLKRIDPWSVMKFSFAMSLVLLIVIVVATAVLYLALDAMGVFDSINNALSSLIVDSSGGSSNGFGFQITAAGVIGTAALLGVVNMILFTALATLGSFIYNVCADLVGGVELTLSEKE